MQEYGEERKRQLLELLKETALANAPEDGAAVALDGALSITRRNGGDTVHRCVTQPLAALMIQGDKRVVVGKREYRIGAGQCLVVGVSVPNSSFLIDVTPDKPLLSVQFSLNTTILAELIMEMGPDHRAMGGENHNFLIVNAPLDFMETLFRLATLIDKPEQAPILAPLILRELHFLLLVGAPGSLLYNLYRRGAGDNRVLGAISWLKNNLDRSVPVEKLARIANMSVSSLHRHFKDLTGFSPLQYHKQLRLYEAQRLMLAENERADLAALAVGYESVTQFNREYKRMFGAPPHRDIVARKRKLSSS